MKIKLSLFLLSLYFVTIISCKKNDEPSKTKIELLTQSPWRFDYAGMDADVNGVIDGPLPFDLLPTCQTDGSITFYSNGKGVSDEGATRCYSMSPPSMGFNWTFNGDETAINIPYRVFIDLLGEVKIIKLSETSLTLQWNLPHGSTTVKSVVILKR